MEQEEDYRFVLNVLKDFERQYSAVAAGPLEKDFQDTKRSIEEDFQSCLDALTVRKEYLLREAEEKFQEQNRVIQELQATLKTSIEGCRKILDAGALLYKEKKGTAISIWKSVDILPSLLQVEPACGIMIEFSHMLLDDIKVHGAVFVRGGEGSSRSLSSSSSSLTSSSNSVGEEVNCVVCKESFFSDSNLVGNCAHKGTWHTKDKCKKLKCKKEAMSYHWSCCDSDKYHLEIIIFNSHEATACTKALGILAYILSYFEFIYLYFSTFCHSGMFFKVYRASTFRKAALVVLSWSNQKRIEVYKKRA